MDRDAELRGFGGKGPAQRNECRHSLSGPVDRVGPDVHRARRQGVVLAFGPMELAGTFGEGLLLLGLASMAASYGDVGDARHEACVDIRRNSRDQLLQT